MLRRIVQNSWFPPFVALGIWYVIVRPIVFGVAEPSYWTETLIFLAFGIVFFVLWGIVESWRQSKRRQ